MTPINDICYDATPIYDNYYDSYYDSYYDIGT